MRGAVSIPTWLLALQAIDTAMAVATDSHRDFLTFEHTVKQRARSEMSKHPVNRVYSFVA